MTIRTKTIGTIVTFDAATQMATVKLACNGTNSTLDSNYFNQEGLTLIDVPVEFPRSAGFVQTFPVNAGDDCIVEFFEQGITHWLYDNQRAYRVVNGRPEAASRRKFDRTDAVCRVSMGNLANAIPGFNNTGFEIRSMDGGQKMVFHPDGIIEFITPAAFKVRAEGNIDMESTADITLKGANVTIEGTTSSSLKSGGALGLSGTSIAMTQG